MFRLVLKLIILNLLFTNILFAKELDKVSIQLQWLDQFEFAGYYIAKEKGFYKDVGLDVELKKYNYGKNIIDEVLSGNTTYAIAGSDIVIRMSQQSKIKLLFSTFQSSPLVLLTTPKSGIKTVKDFKGKRIMITPDAITSATFNAIMKKEKIGMKDLIIQQHSFDVDDLINQKTDLLQSYISNEPYALIKKGIKPIIFNPKDYGYDLYSDIVFTSEYEATNNKQRTINFKNATLRGWEYAFNNIEETVEIILKKYNSQHKTKDALIYEAKELKILAYANNKPLGNIDTTKLQRIFDVYNLINFVNNPIEINNFIVQDKNVNKILLTKEEKEFIKNHPIIKVHNESDWAPYNYNHNGKATGYSIEYMKLLVSKIGLKADFISGYSWNEFVNLIKEEKIDVMLNIAQTQEREKYLAFTSPYAKVIDAMVVNNNSKGFKSLKDFEGKTLAIVKGFYEEELLNKYYPNINIQTYKTSLDALKAVSFGKVDGTINSLGVINHFISTYSMTNISPVFEIDDKKFNCSKHASLNYAL